MLPLEFLGSWSLYVVDTEHKHLLVMYPTMTTEGSDLMRAKHEENAELVLHGLNRCIHENLPDGEISGDAWMYDYNSGMDFSCTMYVMNQN